MTIEVYITGFLIGLIINLIYELGKYMERRKREEEDFRKRIAHYMGWWW